MTHGKFLWNTQGVLCVGSQNLSEAAWGVQNAMPKNAELGVVLVDPNPRQHEKWIQRLPCELAAPNAMSPPSHEPCGGLNAILDRHGTTMEGSAATRGIVCGPS